MTIAWGPRAERRVVVTGIGLVTPLGLDRESTWAGLLEGRRTVRQLVAARDGRLLPGEADDDGWIGAPVPEDGAMRSPEPVVDLALRAAIEAADDARLRERDPERVGCVVGTSKGGLVTARRLLRGSRKDEAADWWLVPPDAAARAVAGRFGTGGPLLCPVLACATGLAALVRGAELVREGTCEAVIAGSSDASLLDLVVGSFRRLGVHAKPPPGDAASACRPFDRTRNGFAVGEGAGILVLESLASARRRGVSIYAEWLGGRTLGDPTSLVQLDESGAVLSRAVDDTLAAAGVSPADIGLLQLHGTGTEPNDVCETRALRRSLPHADNIPTFAVKGAIGHLLGAAGSVETALAALALARGTLPPTACHREPDPACPVQLATHSHLISARYALKSSLGFGGHVAVGLLGPAPSSSAADGLERDHTTAGVQTASPRSTSA